MADKKKERKPLQEMSFTELDYDAIIEHALSLGGKTSVEAIAFLQEMEAEKVPFDDKKKAKRRKVLERKKKRKYDETAEKFITLDEPLYTEDEIEEKLNEIKEVPKYSFLQIKKAYCKKYYRSVIKNAEKKDDTTTADKLAAAMKKAQENAEE
mgnify:FL=1